MATVTLEFPQDVLAALKKSPEEFAEEVRIAAAVQWYAEGVVSQGKAASIAGLSREAFIEELYRRKVPVSQTTAEELDREMEFGQ